MPFLPRFYITGDRVSLLSALAQLSKRPPQPSTVPSSPDWEFWQSAYNGRWRRESCHSCSNRNNRNNRRDWDGRGSCNTCKNIPFYKYFASGCRLWLVCIYHALVCAGVFFHWLWTTWSPSYFCCLLFQSLRILERLSVYGG